MDRQDTCILINSTPKYYYLLPLQLTMIRRYAADLKWPIYIASEVPEDPLIQKLSREFGVEILQLPSTAAGFLESRHVSLGLLPSTIRYVLPLQEDFLLDREPQTHMLLDALFILDTDRFVSSIRLNPCPGPHESDVLYAKEKPWKILGSKNNYIFTYQATLWRRLDLTMYYKALEIQIEKKYSGLSDIEKKNLALVANLGENVEGQAILQKTLPDTLHLSCPRAGPWPNAVYMSPWPYRPTAVVRGKLESWAEELFQREQVKIEKWA